MTVRELIALLQREDPDKEVFLDRSFAVHRTIVEANQVGVRKVGHPPVPVGSNYFHYYGCSKSGPNTKDVVFIT